MKKTYSGSCHCGKVRFDVDMNLDHVRVCDCTVCKKRGALNHRVEEKDIQIFTLICPLHLVPVAKLDYCKA